MVSLIRACLFLALFCVPNVSANAALHVVFAESCGSLEKAQVTSAFDRAAAYSMTLHQLTSKRRADIKAGDWQTYTDWFGVYDQARAERVLAVLDSASLKLNPVANRTVSVDCDPTSKGAVCERGDFAATHTNQRGDWTIYVCKVFFSRKGTERFNTQWGAVLHEATHAGAGTEDFAVGRDAALRLVQSNPFQAIENADNYEYFGESIIANH